MINNKKGLSAIVTTLLVILLVLVAVGIVWGVVSRVLNQGAESFDIQTKCLSLDVIATSTTCTTVGGACDVIVERTGSSSEVFTGIKVVVKNSVTGLGSDVITEVNNIETLGTSTIAVTNVPADSNLIESTVYFTNNAGEEVNCPNPGEYNFVAAAAP
jgi:flagellin-like protein